ncbi:hypothetical protein RVBP20_0420 [Pseudomonas phage sp. NK1]|nr:hypothetical protein RVBP20_0420 [Pseudomonas phage sp. NK1]
MAYYNAVPRVVFNGIRDRSRRPLIRPDITFAQHCPLLRLFTETGPTETTYVGDSDDGFASIYGQASLDPRSKFFNTQSLLALNLLGRGNGFYVKRLRPEDAANPSRLIVAIEIVEDEIPLTIRRLSGFNYPNSVRDIGNAPVPTADKVDGLKARIILIEDNTSEVGTQRVLPGTLVSDKDGSQSLVYPLFEAPVSFFGKLGDSNGMRIWSTTTADIEEFDEAAMAKFKTRQFRIQLIEKPEVGTSPVIVKTADQQDYLNITFDKGVYSDMYNADLYVGDVLVDSYSDDGVVSGLSPLYSPFSQFYVYHENIDLVRQMIYDTEMRVNPAAAAHTTAPGEIDFLTFLAVDGDPYQGIQVLGPLDGGITLGKDGNIYASGGTDGTTDLEEYAKLVDIENINFGKLNDRYNNIAEYQFGVLYDTGLPMESKYRAMRVLSARRDLQYFFTTFVETDSRLPDEATELSRVQQIITRLKAFPESTLYGTGVCRAMIVMQSGKLMDGTYRKYVPQLLDVAMSWARYAGAGTGNLVPGMEMDVSPNNRVTFVKDLNVKFFDDRVRAQAWANGATWSQSYDHRSSYYPCLRSVMLDDTSVLLSPITVNICCVLIRLIHKVHAQFSGNATLTPEQLVERCDEYILDLVRDMFGTRVNIIPRTEITPIDANNGTSWTCNVTVEANNPRTTLNFNLETVRIETPPAQQ